MRYGIRVRGNLALSSFWISGENVQSHQSQSTNNASFVKVTASNIPGVIMSGDDIN